MKSLNSRSRYWRFLPSFSSSNFGNSGPPGVAGQLRIESQQPVRLLRVAVSNPGEIEDYEMCFRTAELARWLASVLWSRWMWEMEKSRERASLWQIQCRE
jgi:hypothetical protein